MSRSSCMGLLDGYGLVWVVQSSKSFLSVDRIAILQQLLIYFMAIHIGKHPLKILTMVEINQS